jgi:hypothetical protein
VKIVANNRGWGRRILGLLFQNWTISQQELALGNGKNEAEEIPRLDIVHAKGRLLAPFVAGISRDCLSECAREDGRRRISK